MTWAEEAVEVRRYACHSCGCADPEFLEHHVRGCPAAVGRVVRTRALAGGPLDLCPPGYAGPRQTIDFEFMGAAQWEKP